MKNYKETIGYIDSIYCGSAVDGSGLRVVVFTSGCNLRCPFCHNPETLYEKGKSFNVKQITDKVLRYKHYIKHGGVTISGGEPFLQAEFSLSLAKALAEVGVKTVIETNGTIIDLELIKASDYLIIDVKNQIFSDLSCYEKMLKTLKNLKKECVLTCVIVPGVNDSREKVSKLKELKDRYPLVVKRVKLLPFRKLCLEKYQKINKEFLFKDYPECDNSTIENLKQYL